MSRKALLLVHTNAASPEQEAEFNTWYERVHIPQLLERIPGIVRATRYVASPDRPPLPERYLALYEIEADDPAGVVKAINTAAAAGGIDFTPALDTSSPPVMALYEALPAD
ncbi:hypothetical protein [Acrocarpospora sp. B8E8]|uniref:hypothetical protein n=1 Tax=Acrocarpospora sp. B8E8 TaxID=3153572 RepID=UPI00325C973E